MITKEKLKSATVANLARMATAKGIRGAASMKKDELIKKLLAAAKKGAAPRVKDSKSKSKPSPPVSPVKPKSAPAKVSAKAKLAPANPAGKANRAAKTSNTKLKEAGKPQLGSAAKSGSKPTKSFPNVIGQTPIEQKPLAGALEKPKVAKPAVEKKLEVGSANAGLGKSGSRSMDLELKSTSKKISQPKPVPAVAAKPEPPAKPTNPAVVGKIRSLQQQRAAAKDLAFFRQQMSASEEPKKDRLVLFVRDPFWLQAYWEVTSAGVERAKVALAEDWHLAAPVLRLMTNEEEGISGSPEKVVREIKIHGGVNNWYIDVQDPPQTYRAVIGYLAPGNRFQSLAYSNVVHTPAPGTSDHVDHNWTDLIDNGDRVFSMSGGFEEGASIALREVFEEKLSRPMTRSALSRYGTSDIPDRASVENFFVDAELLIYGKTHRSSEVSISGEPVKLRDDGSFTVRVGLPDKRQVFPVSSTSFDGTYTYTTVLAIERNTKVMEPMSMEPGEDF
ncbi:MAG: DUF4912 domain-containing protein [Planctomycetaceae bacterium]|nr:DUF4912 domain-containing protein [Planctomycetaceae bacterium]